MKTSTKLVLAALLILVVGAMSGVAASPAVPTKQELAQKLLNSRAANFLTPPARAVLEATARGDHRFTPDATGYVNQKASKVSSSRPTGGTPLPNVRVNDPSEDTNAVDQTTQSETSIAVAGLHVAVGFNDSQRFIQPFITGGANLSGYAYSADGGATFTDGGVIANPQGFVNLGDPWLTSDRSGTMYYSTLTIGGLNGDLVVGVASSIDGGKSWTPANPIPHPTSAFFYEGDKDAITAGNGSGNLFDVWDDFTIDPNTFVFSSGLPVAHSTDGGHSWTVAYASKVPLFGNGCSFSQYIGAQPLVVGTTVYDAAELISSDDPNCTGAPITFSEVNFSSQDGGTTWSQGQTIPITSSTQGFGVFVLGAGQYMRNLEFPTLAASQSTIYMSWNDGGDGSGHSHIRLASSKNGGQSWSTSFVTSGSNDEVQPALTADGGGLHIAYYQISTAATGNGQLDVFVSNSPNGNSWKARRVTSQSFPGVETIPQFDPVIAFGYMGDYIGIAAAAGHQYFAWGDNRDTVTNWLWPQGRNDPDVFSAVQ